MADRGEIYNRNRAKQLITFKGLEFKNHMTPTDVDGLLEYDNRAYVGYEAKLNGNPLPGGQRLAFERICNDLRKCGKPVTWIIATHDKANPDEDIDAAESRVVEYYANSGWRHPTKEFTTRGFIEKFLEYVEIFF